MLRSSHGSTSHPESAVPRRATLLASAGGLLALSGGHALADCAPNAPSAGQTVTCTGVDNDGFAVANTPVAVDIQGTVFNPGVAISGTGNSTVSDSGRIEGQGGVAVRFDGVTGFTKTFNNTANGTVNGGFLNAFTGTGAGRIVIYQFGVFNGGVTITGNGRNELTVGAGRSIGPVNMQGATNYVDNSGTFNQDLQLTATVRNTVVNRHGAALNFPFRLAGDGSHGLINLGRINTDVNIASHGSSTVLNRDGGVITGTIRSTGTSTDGIDNEGIVNGSILLGDGDDLLVNRVIGTVGTVDGTIDLGAGNDRADLDGDAASGVVNGQFLMGPGDDTTIIRGGTVNSTVQGNDGDDYLLWSGGVVRGVDMGVGADVAVLVGLTTALSLTPGVIVDGGPGQDQAFLHGVADNDVSRYRNWEDVLLLDSSSLTFMNNQTLSLGADLSADRPAARLFIDSSSTAFGGAGTHSVSSSVGGPLIVENYGLIDLTNGAPAATDRFVVAGDYLGGGEARIALQTVLGTDGSPSDQLVVRGADAQAAGVTSLLIVNLGGLGALTTTDGIRVVDAQGGAATDDAFVLGGPVAAGLFEYLLFKGGIAPGAEESWFLRSHDVGAPPEPPPPPPQPITPAVPVLPPPPEPPPEPPPPTPPDPTPTPTPPPEPPPLTPSTPPGTPEAPSPPDVAEPAPEGPGSNPSGGAETPLVRPEAPAYSLAPALAQAMGLMQVGTFHERQGARALLSETGAWPAGWARIAGGRAEIGSEQRVSGTNFQLAPRFDGNMWLVQAGVDLLARESGDGGRDRVGLFYTHAESSGDVYGNVVGETNVRAGAVDLASESLGAYATRIGAAGWYADAVLMYTWITGDGSSLRGIGADLDGTSLVLSLEGGIPFEVARGWTLEPQAQLIYQQVSIDGTRDPFADIRFEDVDAATGRFGLRLEGAMEAGGRAVRPFLSADVWRTFATDADVVFNDRSLVVDHGSTRLNVAAGVSLDVGPGAGLYARVGWDQDLDGPKYESFGGGVGVRVRW